MSSYDKITEARLEAAAYEAEQADEHATILRHVHSYNPDALACEVCGGRTYEIQTDHGQWCTTSQWMFRSWSGPRRLDGLTFGGAIYLLGSDKVYEREVR
jgi:hypothetical protein